MDSQSARIVSWQFAWCFSDGVSWCDGFSGFNSVDRKERIESKSRLRNAGRIFLPAEL